MLVARPGRSPVMVGRGAELDRLRRLTVPPAGAVAGPTVALVGGEAGVGKTRLVQELVGRVGASAPVLAGQAEPGALGRPFELLLDAVQGFDVDDGLVSIVADHRRPLEERVAAGISVVESLAAGGRAVVVFEDLHWADSESLTLFERLAEPDCGPLVLVGTYRPDAVHRRHPFGELLHRLERRHAVTHLRLGRLTPTEVGAFLTAVYGRAPTYRVVEALHARTGGNPYFLEELLGAGGDDPESLVDQPLPWSLAELARSQLGELTADDRRIVEAAAVLGQRVRFDLLAEVTATTEEQLIDHLRTLVARGLLVEDEEDVFSFRHALTRETIEAGLLGRERRRLHRAALDALCDDDADDLAAVAQHAAAAGDHERMVAAGRAGAAEALRRGSPFQALQLAETALTEADDDDELLAAAAHSAWLAGLIPDAAAHNQQRLDCARRRGDLEAEAASLRLAVRLAWEAGDARRHLDLAHELGTLAERLPDGHEKGLALSAVAQAAMLREEVATTVEWADRALDLADRIGDKEVRAQAMAEKGSVLVQFPDSRDVAQDLLVEAADLAESMGDDITVARALYNLVRADTRPGDPELARRQLERMRAAAERVGFDSMAGVAHAQGLASLAEWEGDIDAALAAMAEGRANDRGHLFTAKGPWFAVHEAGLAIEAGELTRAAEIAATLGGAPGGRAPGFDGLVAHVALRGGDLAGARAALAHVVAAGGEPGAGKLGGWMVHDLVAAGLAAGLDVDELQLLADRIVPLPGEVEVDPPVALVGAQLAEARGDLEAAAAGYAAAGADETLLFAYERGTALVGLARCLVALGRAPEAREHAEAATLLLARWRGWRVAELDAVRRRLGMASGASDGGALTPREREVVALVAEGLTNAELAARLYISPKTAAVHVSNVLAKLGMSSRTEVAAWAVREQLTATAE